jgi:light-regulated signal transduction histidine kinase (bacteriophytochrome)
MAASEMPVSVPVAGSELRGCLRPLRKPACDKYAAVLQECCGSAGAIVNRLFRVFERLHRQSEYEGNGVGLCVVQRILHRHDGEVTIDGKLGSGATVEFWWPRRGTQG